MAYEDTVVLEQYACDGSTVTFPFAHLFYKNEDIGAVLRDTVNGTSSFLAYPSAFSVTGAGSPLGGSITTTATYSSDYELTVFRGPALTQIITFILNGSFNENEVEKGINRIVMMLQKLDDDLKRARKYSISEPSGYLAEIPDKTTRALKVEGYDSNGDYTLLNIPSTTDDALFGSATATGTNTYAVTFAPVPDALDQNDLFFVKFTNPNTVTNPTLNTGVGGDITMINEHGGVIPIGALGTTGHLIKYNGANYVVYGLNVGNVEFLLQETGHGFNVGDPVGWDGSNWVDINADANDFNRPLIVSRVVGLNSFMGMQKGLLSTSGLSVGVQYLDTTSGLTTTKPTYPNYILTMGYAKSTTELFVDISTEMKREFT